MLFYGLLTLFMLVVMAYDAIKFTIPNWLSLMVAAMYPAALLTLYEPVDLTIILQSIGLSVATLLVGFVFFAFGWFGGGDAKLLAAIALWFLPMDFVNYLIFMALYGGLLTAFLVFVRPALEFVMPHWTAQPWFPRLLKQKEKVPYGLAISAAFLTMLWTNQVFILVD